MSVRILVADDDPVLRDTFSEILQEEEYTVDCAPDGAVALRLLRKNKYDVTFLDLKMPKMDGIQVLAKIMEEKIETIPIMITGYGTIESAVEAMKMGAYDYIQKPFEMTKIMEVINNALSEKKFMNNVSSAMEHADPFTLIKDLAKTHPILCLTPSGDTRCREIPGANCVYVGAGGEIHPRHLYRINDIITIFVKKNPRAIIFVNCLEELLGVHRWEDILTTLSKMITELSESGVRFVITMPKSANKELEREIIHLIAEKHIQPISDSLSNPIRRNIIRILKKDKKATFSVIMQSVKESDSPKLSFHLRKLSQDDIISKEGEYYTLTQRGLLISETLDKLESGLANDPQGTIALIYKY